MKKILFINVCVRPESRTHILAQQVLAKMSGLTEEVNLEQAQISPLNGHSLQERLAYASDEDFSAPMFQYARQFVDADEIVIAAPYWDLSFPAILRTYLEAVTVCGLSFQYSNEGRPQGLCKAQRLIYITTAGGVIQARNFGYDYIEALAQTIYGIPEVLYYKAEKLDIQGIDSDQIMAQAITLIKEDKRI